jgi:hypothetical protein
MKNSNKKSATSSGVQALPMCSVCKKPIANKAWFHRRLEKTEDRAGIQALEVLLCSSACALRYFGNLQPGGNSYEPNYDGYEHSPHIGESQKPSKARSAKNSRKNNNLRI